MLLALDRIRFRLTDRLNSIQSFTGVPLALRIKFFLISHSYEALKMYESFWWCEEYAHDCVFLIDLKKKVKSSATLQYSRLFSRQSVPGSIWLEAVLLDLCPCSACVQAHYSRPDMISFSLFILIFLLVDL